MIVGGVDSIDICVVYSYGRWFFGCDDVSHEFVVRG